MQLKNEHHSFTGMQRDLNPLLHPVSFLYDAHNIRLTPREGDTMLAITNEKGTKDTEIAINGTYIGHCLLNKYLVVFSVGDHIDHIDHIDYITRIDLESLNVVELFNGNLNFSTDCKIDAIASYENEDIQKVYWVDGRNQPRFINIVADKSTRDKYNSTYFDFVPELALEEEVNVIKRTDLKGEFPSGVIQYAFTYYRKHGQESNIFHVTPLYYVSPEDRGASPEEKVNNVFEITVTHVDTNFDYLRIYSIQRTSINGTPICKRVMDLDISAMRVDEEGSDGTYFTYRDTGYQGDNVDPTELLYKANEPFTASTIEQKDNTLFFGNIKLERNHIKQDILGLNQYNYNVGSDYRVITPKQISDSGYKYYNQLNCHTADTVQLDTIPCSGFKYDNYYRLGIQLQHKTGCWSEPIFIKDSRQGLIFSKRENNANDVYQINVPVFSVFLNNSVLRGIPAEYIKIRPVVVFPEEQDKHVLYQGVINPTLYTSNLRGTEKSTYAQSSWFFRPVFKSHSARSNTYRIPVGNDVKGNNNTLTYQREWNDSPLGSSENASDPKYINDVEIQGQFGADNRFMIDNNFLTFHSPDIEFNDTVISTFPDSTKIRRVGLAKTSATLCDIDLQTETPPLGGTNGFIHKTASNTSTTKDNADSTNSYKLEGITAGAFYSDNIVYDSSDTKIKKASVSATTEVSSLVNWMVYPWQRNGSINNDFNRPADAGTQSAKLKKKVISNLRFTNTSYFEKKLEDGTIIHNDGNTDLQSKPQLYNSEEAEILKLGEDIYRGNIDTMLNPDEEYRLHCNGNIRTVKGGLQIYNSSSKEWKQVGTVSDLGNHFSEVAVVQDPIRMRYKSTPHLVVPLKRILGNNPLLNGDDEGEYAITELVNSNLDKDNLDIDSLFGGKSKDALMSNVWLPCGEAESLYTKNTKGEDVLKDSITVVFKYGDTYFQRYDCLKTYPFTKEDPNQIVEIGSFMLETYINIDGRYDRNRGQISNINMSPTNFNLINMVYSQRDNFFTYRILSDDYYNINRFPNQITWTKEKQAGADIDAWTNITLASTYDMDGSKGEITSLNAWKDLLYCFQNKGVSNILFNSRVQIPVSDGVPIEITNSYKVDGYRYLSDGIGCDNKNLVKETPSGLYFIDSVSKDLFFLSDSISDLSVTHNMSTWFKENGENVNKIVYDDINHDVYLVSNTGSLCYSEVLNQFTSFMDYKNISLIETHKNHVFTLKDQQLYYMFEGDYNSFFGEFKPWYFTFISNGSDAGANDLDKIFSNLDYRISVSSDNNYLPYDSLDYIKVENEYQNTREVTLKKYQKPTLGVKEWKYYPDSNLQKKFMNWRIQIPRNNNSLDRIRNTWCKITLGKNIIGNVEDAEYKESNTQMAILYDLNVQYYI